MKKAHGRKWLTWICMAILLLCTAAGFAAYVNDYYRADSEAVSAFCVPGNVSRHQLVDGTLIYQPEQAVGGLVFYPGGKVEHTAYEPLMKACASKGLLCVLVEMPLRLAVLDINAADGIQETYPDIEHWYIGGHSLGGSMAATYLADHEENYDGLILLGSYSAADLSSADVAVLSVYGSEDRVMNHQKYTECADNLPADFREIIIEGGCHAYFGMYGAQEGDGIPSISSADQILLTADAIAAFAVAQGEGLH